MTEPPSLTMGVRSELRAPGEPQLAVHAWEPSRPRRVKWSQVTREATWRLPAVPGSQAAVSCTVLVRGSVVRTAVACWMLITCEAPTQGPHSS